MRKDEKDTFGSAWDVKRTGLGGSFGKAKGRHFPCSCFTCFKSRDINNEGGKLMDSFAPQTFCCGKIPNGMSLGACGVIESLGSFHRGLSQRLVGI